MAISTKVIKYFVQKQTGRRWICFCMNNGLDIWRGEEDEWPVKYKKKLKLHSLNPLLVFVTRIDHDRNLKDRVTEIESFCGFIATALHQATPLHSCNVKCLFIACRKVRVFTQFDWKCRWHLAAKKLSFPGLCSGYETLQWRALWFILAQVPLYCRRFAVVWYKIPTQLEARNMNY